MIALNQDPAGVAGDLLWQAGPLQVWACPLADGGRGVLLLNTQAWQGVPPTPITVTWPVSVRGGRGLGSRPTSQAGRHCWPLWALLCGMRPEHSSMGCVVHRLADGGLASAAGRGGEGPVRGGMGAGEL